MPDEHGYMTDEESRAHYQDLLDNNPGTRWIIEHCGKTWKVSECVPPVVLCPVCMEAVAGYTDDTCTITCDGCHQQCPRAEIVEFIDAPPPMSEGLDDRDEFYNGATKFGHQACADKLLQCTTCRCHPCLCGLTTW